MLTKEQEIKIRYAAATAWSTAVPGMNSVAEAVAAGIKYYDYLKEAEEVKAANDRGINEMLLDEAIKYCFAEALNNDCPCQQDLLRLTSWLAELKVRRSKDKIEGAVRLK